MTTVLSMRARQIALAAAVTISAACIVAYAQVTADEIQPSGIGGAAWDVSERPVTTTLHKYDSKAKRRYTITGESVTFAFPVAYYFWGENQKGGAQRSIALDVDRTDLSAIAPVLRELRRPERFLASQSEIAAAERRRTLIQVHSSLPAYDTPLFAIKRGELRALEEEYCGLELFVEADTRKRDHAIAQSPAEPPYPFSIASVFVSTERIDSDKIANDFLFKATCEPSTRYGFCNVSSYLDRWAIKFKIQKDKLCEWRNESDRIRDFLARHIVGRTDNTSAPARR